jgi:hypothetical protein
MIMCTVSKSVTSHFIYSGLLSHSTPVPVPQAAVHGRIPAFHAVISVGEIAHLGDHQPIVFNSVKLNHGNVYNNGDGVFTAPTSGTYAFTWRIMIDGARHQFTQLVVNGAIYQHAYVHTADASETETDTTFTLVDMSAGSTAWIRTNMVATDGRAIHGNTYSTFSGWLLQAHN